MAYSKRKYSRRFKGVKWVDSPFADSYKQRVSLLRVIPVASCVSGLARIKAIQSTPAETPEAKVKKATAIAQTVIDTHIAVFKGTEKAKELALSGIKV